jgi:hypothetical protein
MFWDITPFSLLKVKRRLGGTCHLHVTIYFLLVSYLSYFSTLKMEYTCSSEALVDF